MQVIDGGGRYGARTPFNAPVTLLFMVVGGEACIALLDGSVVAVEGVDIVVKEQLGLSDAEWRLHRGRGRREGGTWLEIEEAVGVLVFSNTNRGMSVFGGCTGALPTPSDSDAWNSIIWWSAERLQPIRGGR